MTLALGTADDYGQVLEPVRRGGILRPSALQSPTVSVANERNVAGRSTVTPRQPASLVGLYVAIGILAFLCVAGSVLAIWMRRNTRKRVRLESGNVDIEQHLNDARAELDKERAKIANLIAERDAAQTERDQERQKASELEAEANTVREERDAAIKLSGIKLDLGECVTTSGKVTGSVMADNLSHTESEIATPAGDQIVRDRDAARVLLKAAKTQGEKWKGELDAAIAERDVAKNNAMNATKRVEEVIQEREAARNQAYRTSNDLFAARRERDSLRRERDDARRLETAANRQRDEARTQLDQLRLQLAAAMSQTQRKQEQLDALTDQVRGLRITIKGHEDDIKKHLGTIEELKLKVGHLHDMAMQPLDITLLREEVLRLRSQLPSADGKQLEREAG